MLSGPLPVLRSCELNQLTLPSPRDVITRGVLRSLDFSGQVADGIDSVIERSAAAMTSRVPAAAQYMTSLVPLPDTVDKAIIGVVDFVTQGGMWLAKITAVASVQGFLFGVPAWAQASRIGVAVWGTTAELQHGDTSTEFLTRCLRGDPWIRHTPGHQKQDDVTDIKNCPERIKYLADIRATQILGRIEEFYKRHLGESGGRVIGLWARGTDLTARDAGLERVHSKLSQRLQAIFTQDLSPHETAVQINKAAAMLNSEFGMFRYVSIGALGTLLGVAWHTGVLHTHAAIAWGYVTSGVGYALKVSVREVRRGLAAVVSWGKERIKSSVEDIKGEIHQSIEDQVKSSLTLKGMTKFSNQISTTDQAQTEERATAVIDQHKPNIHPGLVSEKVLVGIDLTTGAKIIQS